MCFTDLQRLFTSRDDENAVEAQRDAHLFGDGEVPVVDRIERTAENADGGATHA
jgi:hypothetical protein